MNMRRVSHPCQNQRHAQSGSALLVVLLMLGTIAALATVVSRSVSGALLEMTAARLSSQDQWDLRTGIELGVATIHRLGQAMRSAEASVSLPDRRIHVRIINERARIDLNAASSAVLSALLQANGIAERDAAALAQNVLEWRGGSAARQPTLTGDDRQFPTFTGVGVAELRPDTELRTAPRQMAGTRFFFHPVQLASVPGFSGRLVSRLLPLVTVANGTNRVDPFIASRRVVMALPGVSPATADAFLHDREANSGQELAVKMLGVADALVTSSAAAGWRIEITSTRQARTYRSEAVVAVLDGDSQAYRVLYVLDAQ
jgi:general secretion pathway protein K